MLECSICFTIPPYWMGCNSCEIDFCQFLFRNVHFKGEYLSQMLMYSFKTWHSDSQWSDNYFLLLVFHKIISNLSTVRQKLFEI